MSLDLLASVAMATTHHLLQTGERQRLQNDIHRLRNQLSWTIRTLDDSRVHIKDARALIKAYERELNTVREILDTERVKTGLLAEKLRTANEGSRKRNRRVDDDEVTGQAIKKEDHPLESLPSLESTGDGSRREAALHWSRDTGAQIQACEKSTEALRV
ncbi:hypothetical protein NMY22_g12426 [Coprinellus aureogranulatus]|nr:hypothetical protein NMY22_g12426 [Coprinellus aureogranulatus]